MKGHLMITHHDKAFLAAEDDLRRLPAGDRPDFLQRLRDGWGADFYDLWKSRLAALGRPLEGLQDS